MGKKTRGSFKAEEGPSLTINHNVFSGWISTTSLDSDKALLRDRCVTAPTKIEIIVSGETIETFDIDYLKKKYTKSLIPQTVRSLIYKII